MKYSEDIYILDHIKRYSTVHTIRSESVASHSFFVAAILFDLYERYYFDIGKAIQMAICHDMPEIELNDVPRLIKKKYPQIARAFKTCEKKVLKLFPKSIQGCIASYAENDTVEAKMVHYADAIQCKQFAQTEVNLGNTGYMQEVLDASIMRIAEFNIILEEYER